MKHLTLAGMPMGAYHVCAFFDSREEEYDLLSPFFKQGLEQGEKNLHIVDPELVEEHKSRLTASGIDAHECCSCGKLEVLPWNKAYLDDDGCFDNKRMLNTVDELTSAVDGATGIRIMGNMDWAFKDGVTSEKLIAYEAEVNDVLARNQQPAICVYDTAKLSGVMLMDLLRTHPLTLIGGVLQENPFYTPPTEMLEELALRKARNAR